MTVFLAALILAMIAAPLGCLVVWRRMAYFGDALSHTALLGIALGLMFGLDLKLSTAVICAFFVFLLVWLENQQKLGTDTLLGILAHGGLAVGLVLATFLNHDDTLQNPQESPHHAMETYLFGTLDTVSQTDLLIIALGAVFIGILLKKTWQPLILMTLSADLARAEGVHTLRMQYAMLAMMALIVTLAMQITGVLFITSLLIIPAAAARQISTTPEKMATLAIGLAILGVFGGFPLAEITGQSLGPVIVTCFIVLFIICLLLSWFFRQKKIRL